MVPTHNYRAISTSCLVEGLGVTGIASALNGAMTRDCGRAESSCEIFYARLACIMLIEQKCLMSAIELVTRITKLMST